MIGDSFSTILAPPVDLHQIPSIFQQDAKATSEPTHFGTHPEGPVFGARWRTTADEDTAASNNFDCCVAATRSMGVKDRLILGDLPMSGSRFLCRRLIRICCWRQCTQLHQTGHQQ